MNLQGTLGLDGQKGSNGAPGAAVSKIVIFNISNAHITGFMTTLIMRSRDSDWVVTYNVSFS